MTKRPTPERLEEIREASIQAKNLPVSAHIRAEITLRPEAAEELLAEIDALEARLSELNAEHTEMYFDYKEIRLERDAAVKELKAWKAGHLDSHRAEVATLRDALVRSQAEAAQMREACESLVAAQDFEGVPYVPGSVAIRKALQSSAGKEILDALEMAEVTLGFASRFIAPGLNQEAIFGALEAIRKARGR